MESIKKSNSLNSEIIRNGDELIIPLSENDNNSYESEAKMYSYSVQRGDTLSEIAINLNIDEEKIIQLNDIENSFIRIGQELKYPHKGSPGEFYIVEKGDSLSKISLLFDISQEDLKKINKLNSDSLIIGQKLYIYEAKAQIYTVKKGDSLWNIAISHNISANDLMLFNNLDTENIQPGQKLEIYSAEEELNKRPVNSENQVTMLASIQEKPKEEYVHYKTDNNNQPSRSYAETRLDDPLLNYKQAKAIIDEFDRNIQVEGRISNDLKGYYIVLDPGHGGLDPGAIVESKDGNGNTVYVLKVIS